MFKKRAEKLRFKHFFLWLACFLFLWLFFSLAAASYLDPDFGWHFRTGQWIWQNRAVPQIDLFSYTMPEYRLKYPGWLGELFLYKAYFWWGYHGLAVFFGLIGALALMIAVAPAKIEFAFIPLLLAGLTNLSFLGVRPKMFSAIFAAVVFLIIRKSYQKPSYLLFLPLLFMFWANLHGGFFEAWGVLVLSLLADFYDWMRRKKENLRHLSLILVSIILSLGATLINPYGWRIYQEILATFFSPQLHFQISEWLPYSSLNLGMLVYVSGLGALVFLQSKKITFFEKLTASVLLVNGLWSRRLITDFLIFTLPVYVLLIESTFRFLHTQVKFQAVWRHKRKFLIAFLMISGILYYLPFRSFKLLAEERGYPTEAVIFLQEKQLTSNLFSTYNWGGYLIWKLPEKKVFVDGRMAIWRDHGYSAFEEGNEIITGKKDYQPVFEKFSISAALLPIEQSAKKSWISLLFDLLRPRKPVLPLSQRLLSDGWQLIYQDKMAQILVNSQ